MTSFDSNPLADLWDYYSDGDPSYHLGLAGQPLLFEGGQFKARIVGCEVHGCTCLTAPCLAVVVSCVTVTSKELFLLVPSPRERAKTNRLAEI